MITDGPVTGWRCAVCGVEVPVSTAFPWRCPRATDVDRHHVLHPVGPGATRRDDGTPLAPLDDERSFVRWGPWLAWWSFARAHGMSDAACTDLTASIAHDVVPAPLRRSASLTDALDLAHPVRADAGVWVQDQTGDVAGSHKARHLLSILLHLRAAEELGLLNERPPLAIASCGNAALAAATLARRVQWPIRVFVPVWMDDAFGRRLDELGAETVRCPRRDDDPPGDPAMHRFRDAVAAGAVPFSVQGPENAVCLDGGRTLGWELAQARPDRVYVQVGGGAFAACTGAALGAATRFHAVQVEGCAPLVRAWSRVHRYDHPEHHWAEVMTPWVGPHSLADGILDDETYDWIGVVEAMRRSEGDPVVVAESAVVEANARAHEAGFRSSHTGSAGLAGLLVDRDRVQRGERVAVVMSGVAR